MRYLPFMLYFFTLPVFANETVTQVPAVDPVSSAYLLKLTIGLILVVLLIFTLAWLMKKMQLTPNSQNGLIQIVSAISVGQRDRIAIIQVGDEQLLIGLTPGRIEKLHTLKENLTSITNNTDDNQSFSERFNQLLKRDENR